MNKTLTFPEAKYLKHAGQLIDVKVTIRIVDGVPVIYMRDFEFHGFQQAVNFLRKVVETEMTGLSTAAVAQS